MILVCVCVKQREQQFQSQNSMENRMHRPGSILRRVFNEICVQKLIQIDTKFGCKATLVGDMILERSCGDSGANGAEVILPREGFGGVMEPF